MGIARSEGKKNVASHPLIKEKREKSQRGSVPPDGQFHITTKQKPRKRGKGGRPASYTETSVTRERARDCRPDDNSGD